MSTDAQRIVFCQATNTLPTDIQIEIWKLTLDNNTNPPDAPRKSRPTTTRRHAGIKKQLFYSK